ncbi:MAG: serine/threonine protein kinase [Deltaproteobacteria bacterium]|nr:serine/threonine protein kinase [Deltaproteobacteria bacterium]
MALEPGTVVGERYRVVSSLGEGAMGSVYVVEHTHMANRLAMKLLKPDASATPTLPERFLREAQSIARLDHPGIVRVSDFGDGPHGLFMVMELVSGTPLARRASPALELLEAIDVVDQILAALEHAHGEGVVHRDLKPDNVMIVEKAGRRLVKVLDFGLAKLADAGGESLTREGMVFGTPRYMAPEQASGEPVDGRADLYAAGTILFELLSGATPFDGQSPVDILRKQVGTRPPPLVIRDDPRADVPRLIAAVARSLEKDPSDRFADARAFRAELAAIRRGSNPPHEVDATFVRAADPADATFVRADTDTRERTRDVALATPRVEETLEVAKARAVAAARARLATLLPLISSTAQKLRTVPRSILIAGAMILALAVLAPFAWRSAKPDPLEAAEAALAAGDLSGAKTLAAQAGIKAPDAPRVHLVLGKIAFAENEISAALSEYNRAILNDPKLAADKDVESHVRILMEKDKARGTELLKLIAARGDIQSAPFLAELSRSAPTGALRRTSYEAVERLMRTGLLGPKAYLLSELEKESRSDCETRRWYVKRLIELGDPEVVPALKKEAGRRGGFLNLFSQSECMSADIEKALKAIAPDKSND